MEKMEIYSALRQPPPEALKPIQAGRLKGKSDINPMWRIKALTEQFGPCGVGWKYEIVRQWTEPGADGEVCAMCNINLYYKADGEWSEAIPGTGGSMLVANERSGPYTSDECYKMAMTDALSVACKAIGVAADVYWGKDPTKYDARPEPEPPVCAVCGETIAPTTSKSGKEIPAGQVAQIGMKRHGKPLCAKCLEALKDDHHS